MVYGIYQSAAGLQLNQYRQEILANNLANLDTAGFKRDFATIRERRPASSEQAAQMGSSDRALAGLTGGSLVAPTHTSLDQGTLDQTNGRLDVALMGDGFFTVQDGNDVRYTRDGRLTINEAGELVTVSGHKVLGEGGEPIVVPDNLRAKATITSAGDVRAGATELGRIGMVDFKGKSNLRKVGANLFDAQGAEPTESHASLQVGFVEQSNVEPMDAMVSMIQVSRAYELNATMLNLADSTLGRAVNDIAQLR